MVYRHKPVAGDLKKAADTSFDTSARYTNEHMEDISIRKLDELVKKAENDPAIKQNKRDPLTAALAAQILG